MRIYGTKTFPAEERTIVVEMRCDLCHTKARYPAHTHPWQDEDEVKLSLKEGRFFPEGDFRIEYFFDICPACFHNKLIPWMESQGAEVQEREMEP